jgi:hypothetical protein
MLTAAFPMARKPPEEDRWQPMASIDGSPLSVVKESIPQTGGKVIVYPKNAW